MPITGVCPYSDCSGSLWLTFDEDDQRLPAFGRSECETCHRPFWTRYSRYDSWSMPEADFLAEYDVDHVTKRITKKETAARPSTGA